MITAALLPIFLDQLIISDAGNAVVYIGTGEVVEFAHVQPGERKVVLKRFKEKGETS